VIELRVMLAAGVTALAAALASRLILRPTRRLAGRVRPYSIGARTTLGRSADVRALAAGSGAVSAVRGLFGPLLSAVAVRAGRLIERGGDEMLVRKLSQSGMYPELGEQERLSSYRMRQLTTLLGWLGAAVFYSLWRDVSTRTAVALVVLGAVIGVTRVRGRLEAAIEDRRARMRIEIYTVNQLLAVRARAGGGVIQAVSRLVDRGRGEVVAELKEALRMHRAGMRAAEAFRHIAEATPEPACARTYSLLAIAEERGVDLADGLLSLSEDVRESRREAIRRSATKRRAAMLVPTIAILAPIMLVFVGAPLPQLVLSWR